MRLRSTALPAFLVTVRPTQGQGSVSWGPGWGFGCRGADCKVKAAKDLRRPRATRWKSARLFSRPSGAAAGTRLASLSGNSGSIREVAWAGKRLRTHGGRPGRRAGRSGGELLAAGGAPRVQDLAAGGRRRSGAEAVPPLANELAGLIGPLHDRLRCRSKRSNAHSPASSRQPFHIGQRAGKKLSGAFAPLFERELMRRRMAQVNARQILWQLPTPSPTASDGAQRAATKTLTASTENARREYRPSGRSREPAQGATQYSRRRPPP